MQINYIWDMYDVQKIDGHVDVVLNKFHEVIYRCKVVKCMHNQF